MWVKRFLVQLSRELRPYHQPTGYGTTMNRRFMVQLCTPVHFFTPHPEFRERVGGRRWISNPSGKCLYERPTRGTVCGTMRSMRGTDAVVLAIDYLSRTQCDVRLESENRFELMTSDRKLKSSRDCSK